MESSNSGPGPRWDGEKRSAQRCEGSAARKGAGRGSGTGIYHEVQEQRCHSVKLFARKVLLSSGLQPGERRKEKPTHLTHVLEPLQRVQFLEGRGNA